MKLRRSTIITSLILIILLTISTWQASAAPPNQQAALSIINYPGDNEIVRGIISITGSATHPAFDRFQVAYASEPVTRNDAWVTIGIERTDQVVNGELAIWDTTTVPDGSYSLRLRVIRRDGNYSEIEVKQVVVANTQPTATFTPNTPPTSSVPIATPTPLPPTPTVLIVQPIVDTPTPRSLAQVGELPTPRPTSSGGIPIPDVEVDTAPLKSGCLWGAGLILLIFLFFGFLSAIRIFVMGFVDHTRNRRR
jgi:hypothetical protein